MSFPPEVMRAYRTTRVPRPVRLALVVLGLFVALWWSQQDALEVEPPRAAASDTAPSSADDLARLREAFAAGRGDLWVTLDATVERSLRDDDEGSRHQRFIVRLADDRTLLVAHNIDLAPRVPLEVGDRLRLCGEYEWNAKGGVLHWTHHDPGGRPGGWIELDGRRYE